MTSFDPTHTPAEYASAFRVIAPRLTERHLAILAAHYTAPAHAATSGELAAAMGYQSRQPLNKSMTTIANYLCEALRAKITDPIAILVTSEQMPGREPRLTLRPAVVSALESLGWNK